MQVIADLKSAMVAEWRTASHSFLLDEESTTSSSTSELLAHLDDSVRLTHVLSMHGMHSMNAHACKRACPAARITFAHAPAIKHTTIQPQD